MTGSSELIHANVQAHEILESLPRELKVVSLYLAIIAQRSSFHKLVNDVYLFMKDRYFIGEVLEACLEGKSWYNCTILQVREPTEAEVKDYNDSIFCNEDEQIIPPACLYHYQVEKFCSYNDINRVFEASASHVRRKKRLITKGKLRLFLKQCLSVNARGIWNVQESIQQNLGLSGLKFSDIFVGQPPKFPKRYESVSKKDKNKSSPSEHNVRNDIVVKKESAKKSKHVMKTPVNCFPPNDSDLEDFKNPWSVTDLHSTVGVHDFSAEKSLKPEVKHSAKLVKKVRKECLKPEEKRESRIGHKRKYKGLTWEERQKIKEKKMKKAMLEKLKRREERLKAKGKVLEEKRNYLVRDGKLREDLECEDLKAMPVLQEVKCSFLPNELFGEFMVILEFFQSFQSIVKMKGNFSRGITFGQLESAIVNNSIDGPYCNIIISLLSTVFSMQEDDNETFETETNTIDFDSDELSGAMGNPEAARLAAVELGSRLYQGAFLHALNNLTVTEVLRLHLICASMKADLGSQNQRDDCVDSSNPVIMLRAKHPQILQHLSTVHVCEITIQEKISVLNCLIDQVLACISVRAELEERGEQLRQVKFEIRAYRSAEVKREKEERAQKMKEKLEAKMKLKEGETSQPVPESDAEIKSDLEKCDKELRSNEKKNSELHAIFNRMRSLYLNFNHQPIGKDRAHRRYWIFSSIPGLYVENNPFEIGPCLPQATPRLNITMPHQGAGSPNRKKSPHKSPSKKENNEDSPRVETICKEPLRSETLGCTSSAGCPVHDQNVPRCCWSYFAHKDDVTNLIDSLNKRGIRESELRKFVVRDELWLKETVEKCPFNIVNSVDSDDKLKTSQSSKYRHPNCPPGSSVNYLLELILRERILDLENRIYSGCMGSLDVKDLSLWRKAIENENYDMQCEKLMWGFNNDQSENDVNRPNDGTSSSKITFDEMNTVSDDVISQCEETGTSNSASRNNSPLKVRDTLSGHVLEEMNGENILTYRKQNFKSLDEMEKKNGDIIAKATNAYSKSRTIKNLASAILQLSQSVDVAYLRTPLTDDDENEDQKLIQLKRWEVSLMTSTSLSQLFLHISLLDASIQWSKSVLNARCALCRRRGDGEKMLLCDGCNKGHHLYCLKPKLDKVPDGDWYCLKCRPEQINKTTDKKRKSSGNEGPKEYERRPSKSRKIAHDDVCNACGLKYNLILCSTCPLAFHTECMIPPLKDAPVELWMCPECKTSNCAADEKENESSSSRRSSRRKSGASDQLLNNSLLQDLLSDLMCHRDSWPFLQPVRKAEAPRYHIIIKKPMDLGTMKYKLNRSQYRNNSEFVADALLIFENCRMYNDDDTDVYKSGSRLSQYFKKRCKDIGLNLRD